MFYNIFSDKNPKQHLPPENKNPIIVDMREKQSLVVANLAEKRAAYKLELLKIADYLIGDIAIERKTFSDFISSMINKRLMFQLSELKKYPRHFLIIEGKRICDSPQDNDPSEYCRGKIHRKSFALANYRQENTKSKTFGRNREGVLDKAAKGMILSIITNYQIPIIFSQDEEETAEFLIALARQLEKPKTHFALRHTPTLLTEEEQKQFVLEGFPGVGPSTAKKLLTEFKSLRNIFNADEEKLKKVLNKKQLGELKKLLD